MNATMSKMDRLILANASGLLAVARNNLRRALKVLSKKDQATRDLVETSMTLMDDAQMLQVLVSIPTKEQQIELEETERRALPRLRARTA
jgi:hypothetical protein